MTEVYKNEIWKSSPATMEDIKEKIPEICASCSIDGGIYAG